MNIEIGEVKWKVWVSQSCPTLCDTVDCSPSSSSFHRILQARICEWVAIYFSRGSAQPRHQIWVSCIAGRFFTIWVTRIGINVVIIFKKSSYWWLLFSCSVISDSLWSHELQHARLPCPSPSPGVCSNSCPLSTWCHPTISSSVIPLPSYIPSLPPSGSFPMSRHCA